MSIPKPPDYSAGPIWAIFDADAVKREGWKVDAAVRRSRRLFFQREYTCGARRRDQERISGQADERGDLCRPTVERYNSFVEAGEDVDFGKPAPKHKIQTPPFYAAWATPKVHDTRPGLRINARCQVMDMNGQVIPGLYCAGESAGGFNQHGLGRCTTQGFIAGTNAAREAAHD